MWKVNWKVLSKPPTDQLREMENIEAAMAYVEDSMHSGDSLTEHFIPELHAITVKDLEREGDATPGAYRLKPVQIAQSEHLPPDIGQVPEYMLALVLLMRIIRPNMI